MQFVTYSHPLSDRAAPSSLVPDVPRNAEALITSLFPTRCSAHRFFTRFVSCAQDAQTHQQDAEAVQVADAPETVSIRAASIQALAKHLGFAHETAHTYVTLFRILGLLHKKTRGERTVFVLTRGSWSPPSMLIADLDALIERCRPKKSRGTIVRLAQTIKGRWQIVQYGGARENSWRDETLLAQLERLRDLLRAPSRETGPLLEQRLSQASLLVTRLIREEMVHHRTRTTVQPVSALRRPMQVARSPEERKASRLSHVPVTMQERDLGERKLPPVIPSGDFPVRHLPAITALGDSGDAESLPRSVSRGDVAMDLLPESADMADSTVSPLLESASLGDSSENHLLNAALRGDSAVNLSPESASMGDSAMSDFPESASTGDSQATSRPSESPMPGDSTGREASESGMSADSQIHLVPESPEEGDSAHPLRQRLRSRFSLSAFINTYTLRMPKQVATFLAEQFEHDANAAPKYYKLLMGERPSEPAASHPQIVLAACICTLVRWYRDGWNMSRPGGFFTKRYRDYLATGIPEEVARWVEQYGAIPADELLETLRTGVPSANTSLITPSLEVVVAGTGERQTHDEKRADERDEQATMPMADASIVESTPPRLHASFPSSRQRGTHLQSAFPHLSFPHLTSAQPDQADASFPVLDEATKVEQARMVMNQQQAKELLTFIRTDSRTRLYQAWCLTAEDQEHYAVVVDASSYPLSPGRPRWQTILYSAADWQHRLATMRTWRDLFRPDAPAVPFAQYRAALQEKVQHLRQMERAQGRRR